MKCVKFIFLLPGHKVDFIAPCGANKSTFWPASRKKIVCNTGKTFILLVTLKGGFACPKCCWNATKRSHFCIGLLLVMKNGSITTTPSAKTHMWNPAAKTGWNHQWRTLPNTINPFEESNSRKILWIFNTLNNTNVHVFLKKKFKFGKKPHELSYGSNS